MGTQVLHPSEIDALHSRSISFITRRSGVQMAITSSKLLGEFTNMDVIAVGTEALVVTLCSFPSFHPLPGTKLDVH